MATYGEDRVFAALWAEKARLDAAIAEIESDNSESANFEDWAISRPELGRLQSQLNYVNFKIQQRRTEIQREAGNLDTALPFGMVLVHKRNVGGE